MILLCNYYLSCFPLRLEKQKRSLRSKFNSLLEDSNTYHPCFLFNVIIQEMWKNEYKERLITGDFS